MTSSTAKLNRWARTTRQFWSDRYNATWLAQSDARRTMTDSVGNALPSSTQNFSGDAVGTQVMQVGKWFLEAQITNRVNDTAMFGFCNAAYVPSQAPPPSTFPGPTYTAALFDSGGAPLSYVTPGPGVFINAGFPVNSLWVAAYDADTGKIWVGYNAPPYNLACVWGDGAGGQTGNPLTGANPVATVAPGTQLRAYLNIIQGGQDGPPLLHMSVTGHFNVLDILTAQALWAGYRPMDLSTVAA